jgi:uncharacterized BrkB/YihY/UPF0761 family membrane protein
VVEPPESRLARSRLVIRLRERFPRLDRRLMTPGLQLLDLITVDQVGVEAGSMTYGAFLSIPPMLLLAVTFIDVFLANRPYVTDRLIAAAESALPGLGDLFHSGLKLSSSAVVSAGIVGLATLVWAASGFAVRLRHALGSVFGTELLGLVTGRLGGFVIGIPLIVLLVAYGAAASWLTSHGAAGLAGLVVDVAAYAALLAAGFIVWTTVYRWMTPGASRPTWREHLVGGIAFTIAFLALEAFGAVYVEGVVTKSRALYGAIGALFGLFAFLYLMMWLFVLGAELTKMRRAAR